jgi:predicted nucleotidyltransferase
MTKSETILETLKAHLPELREMGVKDLYVFGSVARGAADPQDIDILVEFMTAPGLLELTGVKFHLEDHTGLPVDVYTMTSCPERFKKRIKDELRHVA